MVAPACRWALALAICWLAAAAGPTKAQVDAAVSAEPLPENVQLLFDIELRGPPGGATNLLPWTAAKEAVVAEVLCRGYLPSATPADVTIEVINTFTFLVPAPTVEATASSTVRRLLRDVAPPQPVGEERQLLQGGQQARRPPVAIQRETAGAPAPAEQPVLGQDAAAAPGTAKAQARQPPEEASAAPAPAVVQPEVASAAPAPAPDAQALARRGEKPAARADQPDQWQKEEQQLEEEAAAPAPAAVQPARRGQVAAAEARAPATERPERQSGAAPAPAPAEPPNERDGKARQQQKERQERQQEEEEGAGRAKEDAPRKEEEAAPQQMVTGTGVELKITLPSKLSRAATELDAVEGAVTVGKLAQDLTAAGLAVDSATLVAAYLEEPLTGSTTASHEEATAAAWAYGGAPATA